jgi:hypothetical protein
LDWSHWRSPRNKNFNFKNNFFRLMTAQNLKFTQKPLLQKHAAGSQTAVTLLTPPAFMQRFVSSQLVCAGYNEMLPDFIVVTRFHKIWESYLEASCAERCQRIRPQRPTRKRRQEPATTSPAAGHDR